MDTFFEYVLPKLLSMTLVSFVVASAVGALVGWIATLIWRGSQRQRKIVPVQPAHSLVAPAILGAFIGLLLGMLLYEANPNSLVGGPYGGLAMLVFYIFILPIGSIIGSMIGAVAGANLPSQLKQPKWAGIALAATYVLAVGILYLGLAPAPLTLTTPQTNQPLPVIAQIDGYAGPPKDLALSTNGQLLAVSHVTRDKDDIDIWDLSAKKIVHKLRDRLEGGKTLKDIVASIAFSADGKELITAASDQVQVRNFENEQVRLRLDGGSVGLPIADNKLITLAVVDPYKSGSKLDPFNLKVWDLSNGKLLQTMPGNLDPVNLGVSIAISPDQRLLAYPPREDNLIEVWDMTSGKKMSDFGGNSPTWPKTLAFSPDGQQLAISLSRTKPLLIWDWQQKKLLKSLPEVAYAEQVYWTTAGILALHEGYFDLLNPQTGKLIKSLIAPEPGQINLSFTLSSPTLSQDGKTLAFYAKEGIKVWRVDGDA